MKKNNVQPIWSILCQESSIDSGSNNISLFKVLEEIKFSINTKDLDNLKNNPKFDPKKPIVLPFPAQMVILWKNLSNKPTFTFPIKIILKDPDAKIIQEIKNEFKFQDGKERLRSIISIEAIPVTKSGEYTYHITTKQSDDENYKEVDSIPLKIVIDMHK